MALDRYFFEPDSPRRLGVCRALFYSWFLLQLLLYGPQNYAGLPAELWRPILILSPFPPPAPLLMDFLTLCLGLALALAAVGLFTRPAVMAAAPLATIVFGVANSYGAISFHLSPLVLIAWVLAFSRCGDDLSLDSLRREPAAPGADYRWPIRLACLVLVVLMFTAGVHKVRGSWLTKPGQTIEAVARYKYYPQAALKGDPAPEAVLAAAQLPWLMVTIGLATLALELCAPLAMVDRWPVLRLVLIGGLFSMQLTLAAMGTLATFPWLGAYFFWIPVRGSS